MSVPLHERRESRLEVFHHWFTFRQEMMSELLYDFGFSKKKFQKKILHQLGFKTIEELTDEGMRKFEDSMARAIKFEDWMVYAFRYKVLDLIYEIGIDIAYANGIYPQHYGEYLLRREYQTKAIGALFALNDLMYLIITTLDVDINRYTRLSKGIDREINLLKAWRKSDKKRYQKIQPDTFADLVNAYKNFSNNRINIENVNQDDVAILGDNDVIVLEKSDLDAMKKEDTKALRENDIGGDLFSTAA